MAKPKAEVVSIVGLRRRLRPVEDIEEVPVGLPPIAARLPTPDRSASGVDLSGRPKAIFLIGPGRAGKTMLARWIGEQAAARSRQVLLAALDPQNRSLARYFTNVEKPDTNDAARVARWLEELLHDVMGERASALIDLGGGDTALGRVLTSFPDMVPALEDSGVAVVAHYLVGPRIDDLSSLGTFEASGFQPAATSIICNAGLADPDADLEDTFRFVRRHSVFRRAVERGAIPLWMPRLDAEAVRGIEARSLQFLTAASEKAPEDGKPLPLLVSDRFRLRHWLAQMDEAFEPVATWAP